MGRRETRENAMKLLYQVSIQKEDKEEQIDRFIEEQSIEEDTDKEYVIGVVKGVMEKQEELDDIISRHSKGWTIQRMPKVDLAIMRLSCYEMKYRKDIPINVSINEAVEMTKKYSGEQSKTFVNGVLGKVFIELNEQTSPED